ncbi:glycoside hydrolase family 127 protein [soil metagenome]
MDRLVATTVIAIMAMGIQLSMAMPPDQIKPKIVPAAELFSLGDVRLLDGPFRDAQETDRDYLMQLDPDRLLAWFRKEAGLKPKGEVYPGWESRGLAGHTLGHYLSALAHMWQATGDQRLKSRVDYIVSELAICQDKNGGGYVGAIPDGQKLFAAVSAGAATPGDAFNLHGMWSPWYTQHKIFAGLIDAYSLCENKQALDVVVGFADWCDHTVSHFDETQMQNMLKVEHGGMAESLARIYAITGQSRYLTLAEKFRHHAVFDPIAAGRDSLDRIHANTQIPKFIGYELIYQLTGDESWKKAAQNFWTFVVHDRSFSLGGNSTREHFFPVSDFHAQVLEFQGPETCNTYNILKLSEQLFSDKPSAEIADFYERGLYNHVLAALLPHQPGAFTYFTTMRPGGFRGYSKPFDDFWCCVGTGMENPARFGEFIYAHSNDKLLVNLFIPSELKWNDVTVRQETQFPEESQTRLTVALASPKTFTLAVRYPNWVAPGALRISINGQPSNVAAQPGSYVSITREWRNGDQMVVDFPMAIHVELLPHSSEYASIFYGPILLAGALGKDGMQDADFRAQVVDPAKGLPLYKVPVITADARDIPPHVRPVPGKAMQFKLSDIVLPGEMTLLPFYALHQQRYEVYWQLMSQEQYAMRREVQRKKDEEQELLMSLMVDQVSPGEQQPEVDHGLQSEKSQTGTFRNRGWRDARDGGSFSYTFKVSPDEPMVLRCTYWGGDKGAREFDISVDGTTVATQRLNDIGRDDFVNVDYPLATALTRGKNKVIVQFQAHPISIAGGVFQVMVLKSNTSSTRPTSLGPKQP